MEVYIKTWSDGFTYDNSMKPTKHKTSVTTIAGELGTWKAGFGRGFRIWRFGIHRNASNLSRNWTDESNAISNRVLKKSWDHT